jgi:hypothetical protein
LIGRSSIGGSLRVTRFALVLLVVCGVIACGQTKGSPDGTIRGYLNAVADARGTKACGYLTGEALVQRGGSDCARRIDGGVRPEVASVFRHLRFRVVSERERSATVYVFVPVTGKKGQTERGPVLLIKRDGAWLISKLPTFARLL